MVLSVDISGNSVDVSVRYSCVDVVLVFESMVLLLLSCGDVSAAVGGGDIYDKETVARAINEIVGTIKRRLWPDNRTLPIRLHSLDILRLDLESARVTSSRRQRTWVDFIRRLDDVWRLSVAARHAP